MMTVVVINCCDVAPKSPTKVIIDAASLAQYGQNSVAVTKSKNVDERRTLQFSGYDWKVKSSDSRVGPGPNYFSDSNDSVFVDTQGRLHLLITQRNGRWYCAEVISTRSFGYGTYRFYLDTNLDNLDPQIVLGMFTWNDAPAYNHREIDIEVSRWGLANNKNAQFVVQPYTHLQNIARFEMPLGVSASIHSFTWKPDSVWGQSLQGPTAKSPDPSNVIQQHTFTLGIPQAGGENARINLWLLAGRAPADLKQAEIIISKFEFVRFANMTEAQNQTASGSE